MKKKPGIDHLTERHLLLFGTIIQWFARYELLMQEVMASVAGTDSGAVMLLTRGLDFNSKRSTLLDLLRRRAIPFDQYDRLNEYLTVPHTLTPLRDDIAHSAWIPGPSSNSVQPDWILRIPPGVRPLHGKGLFEREADSFAYSLESLSENVTTLATNYERLSDYLQEVGLLRASRVNSLA
jgi:hypothetical protein